MNKDHWDNHYKNNGNSGIGSYGELCEYKINIINDYIEKYNIKSIIDFGCGDGNQIKSINIKNYIGLDVSKESVHICTQKYSNDSTKKFFLYDQNVELNIEPADLTLSLDVIYHICNDSDYNKYMHDLSKNSKKYILIYSSNFDDNKWQSHVRHRKFTDKMENHKLIDFIKNKSPISSADFYLFEKN